MEIKPNLDKRICDVEEHEVNTETFREFIENSYLKFYDRPLSEDMDLDSMFEGSIQKLMDFLDYLWSK